MLWDIFVSLTRAAYAPIACGVRTCSFRSVKSIESTSQAARLLLQGGTRPVLPCTVIGVLSRHSRLRWSTEYSSTLASCDDKEGVLASGKLSHERHRFWRTAVLGPSSKRPATRCPLHYRWTSCIHCLEPWERVPRRKVQKRFELLRRTCAEHWRPRLSKRRPGSAFLQR